MNLQPSAAAAAASENSTPLERIANSMLSAMSKAGMPRCFKTDAAHDLKAINTVDAEFFVWLILDRGTTVVPIHKGIHSFAVTYWLKEEGDTKCKAFLINSSQATLTPISSSRAIELISEHPVDLKKDTKLDVLEQTVNEALIKLKGNDWLCLRDKALPASGDKHWKGLHDHFKSLQNDVMTSFMGKAISMRRSLAIRAV